MDTLVIGGTGPTGPHVVNGLVARGHRVAILHTGNHEVDTIPAEVEHIHTDPFDQDLTRAALGDRTFDLAVVMYGRLRDLAPLLAGRCGHFVSVGGVPVYKGFASPDRVFPPGLPVPTLEDGEKAGPEEVGKVLRIIETEGVVFYHHPTATHLRYPLIYGPGQLLPREWLIVRRILDGRPHIIVPDGGLTLRTAAFAENAAHALLLAVDHPEAAAGKAYNVSDEWVPTIAQVIQIIAAELGGDAMEIVAMPAELAPHTRALLATARTTHRVTGIEAIRHDLGYRDLVTPTEALARTARWLVANPLEAGGSQERGLQDPFDYEWEDRLVAAWNAAKAAVEVVTADAPRFRDRYGEGRRGEENAAPPTPC